MANETKDSVAIAPTAADAKLTAEKPSTPEKKPEPDSGHIVLRPAAADLGAKTS